MDRHSDMRYMSAERRLCPDIPLTHTCSRQEVTNYPLFSTNEYGQNYPSQRPLNPGHATNRTSSGCNGHHQHENLRRTIPSQHPRIARANDNVPYTMLENQRFNNNSTRINSEVNQSAEFGSQNQDTLVHLRDKIMVLQIQNLELNLYLKKEELKRKEAEETVKKERNYIKTLEDNIQTLNSSRVIMDPDLYKQVANDYIANRKKPVRRTRTCSPYIVGPSDLVCDDQSSKATSFSWERKTPFFNQKEELTAKGSEGSSCSTSSTDAFQSQFSPSPNASDKFNSPSYSRENSSDSSENFDSEWNIEASSTSSVPLNQEEYQELLKSLESLHTGDSFAT